MRNEAGRRYVLRDDTMTPFRQGLFVAKGLGNGFRDSHRHLQPPPTATIRFRSFGLSAMYGSSVELGTIEGDKTCGNFS